MSKKCKPTLPLVIQAKNWRKTMNIEDKLDVIIQLEKVNKLLTHAKCWIRS